MDSEAGTAERYSHIPSSHDKPVQTIMLDSVLTNPNSHESVKMVLGQIGLDNGIRRYGKDSRYWTFATCDGRPHTLIQDLISDVLTCQNCNSSFNSHNQLLNHCAKTRDNKVSFYREFDWVYLRAGAGHLEMNAMKALIDLLWVLHFCLNWLNSWASCQKNPKKSYVKAKITISLGKSFWHFMKVLFQNWHCHMSGNVLKAHKYPTLQVSMCTTKIKIEVITVSLCTPLLAYMCRHSLTFVWPSVAITLRCLRVLKCT